MHNLSRPIPVSTCFCGSGSSEPFAFLLYCMNTRFQISITRWWLLFTSSTPGTCARSSSLLRSMWISLHGPQGPVSPISQKLSFLFPRMILSAGRCFNHASFASWSIATPSCSYPSNTVAYNLSLSSLYTSVRSSHAQSMASVLK